MPTGETHPRIAYARKEGFLLYTDLADRVLGAVNNGEMSPLEPFKAQANLAYATNIPTSASGLLHATTVIADSMHTIRKPAIYSEADTLAKFGISDKDKETAGEKGMFEGGLADLDFPWFFSAGVANSVAQEFKNRRRITQEQYDGLTLRDWSTLINSQWFSKLMHRLAFTGNGIYRSFGSIPDNYKDDSSLGIFGSIWQSLDFRAREQIRDLESPFEVSQQVENDGHSYIAARLAPALQSALRLEMKLSMNSTGCPVARKAVRLSVPELRANPHVAALVKSGVLVKERGTGDDLVIRQEDTAIDRMLTTFANQLTAYEDAYGTPVKIYEIDEYDERGRFSAAYKAEHEHLPTNGVLRRRVFTGINSSASKSTRRAN